MQKNIFQTISVIIFWDFLIFYQIFVSPRVKRIVIISNNHGIYELSRALPNDVRLRILGLRHFAAGGWGVFVPTQEKKDLGS